MDLDVEGGGEVDEGDEGCGVGLVEDGEEGGGGVVCGVGWDALFGGPGGGGGLRGRGEVSGWGFGRCGCLGCLRGEREGCWWRLGRHT